MSDAQVGFSHLCLPVTKLDKSVSFWQKWGGLNLVETYEFDDQANTARLADDRGGFVLVLAETSTQRARLGGRAHLAVTCPTKEDVDERAASARAEGVMVGGPKEGGPGIGYHAFFVDPDGHQLEVAFGQEVGNIDFRRAELAGSA